MKLGARSGSGLWTIRRSRAEPVLINLMLHGPDKAEVIQGQRYLMPVLSSGSITF